MKFKLARDFLVLSSGQLLSKIIGFVAFAYLARTLGPESYGLVEYAVGLAVVFAMIVDWGLGPIGVRELAAKPETAESTAALVSGARLIIVCIAAPLLGFAVLWSGQSETAVRLVWIYSLSLFVIPWRQDWLLQGREMMSAVAFAELVRMCTFAAVVVALVNSELDILYVGFAEIVAVVITMTYYLGMQRMRVCRIRVQFTPLRVIRLMREGFSVGLSNAVSTFAQYAPLFLVANIVGGVSLAWFAASHRIVVSLLTFSWIYHFNLFPTMARRAVDSTEDFHVLIRASFRVVSWGGVLIALILTLIARPLMALGFGSSFAEAAPAFSVLIWSLPITLVAGHARWSLIAKGMQRYVLFAQLAGAAVVLTVGVALTIRFGAVGASAAFVLASLTIWGVAHLFAIRQIGPLPGLTAVLFPIVGASLAGLLAQGLNVYPLVAAAVATVGYVLFALVFDRKLMPDLLVLVRAKAT